MYDYLNKLDKLYEKLNLKEEKELQSYETIFDINIYVPDEATEEDYENATSLANDIKESIKKFGGISGLQDVFYSEEAGDLVVKWIYESPKYFTEQEINDIMSKLEDFIYKESDYPITIKVLLFNPESKEKVDELEFSF